ncbi:MAG: hypothetical protein WDN72_01495 [Alphaproteobacteria bacterium]
MRLKKRLPAFNTQAFKDGLYEMQDEGSQVVSLLIEAKAGRRSSISAPGRGARRWPSPRR